MGGLLDMGRLGVVTKAQTGQLLIKASKKGVQERTKPPVAKAQGPREPTQHPLL